MRFTFVEKRVLGRERMLRQHSVGCSTTAYDCGDGCRPLWCVVPVPVLAPPCVVRGWRWLVVSTRPSFYNGYCHGALRVPLLF